MAPDAAGAGAAEVTRRHRDVRAPRADTSGSSAACRMHARRPGHRGRHRHRAPDAQTRSGSRRSSCAATRAITGATSGGRRPAGAERPRHDPEVRRRRPGAASTRWSPATPSIQLAGEGGQAGRQIVGRARSTSRWRPTARRRPRSPGATPCS